MRICSDEVFTGFLLSAQQETQGVSPQQVDLDVFLMSWQKVTVRVCSTDPTRLVTEVRASPDGPCLGAQSRPP